MKIINAINELGSFSLVGDNLFVSSSKGWCRYELDDSCLACIKQEMNNAEYYCANPVGFDSMFVCEDLPEHAKDEHPIVVQDIFIAVRPPT